MAKEKKVKNYRNLSRFSFIDSLGIASFYSDKVDDLNKKGDVLGARKASKKAFVLSIFEILLIPLIILGILVYGYFYQRFLK